MPIGRIKKMKERMDAQKEMENASIKKAREFDSQKKPRYLNRHNRRTK